MLVQLLQKCITGNECSSLCEYLAIAWGSAGVYFSRFSFVLLASSTAVGKMRELIVGPARSDMEFLVQRIEAEIVQRADASKGQVKQIFLQSHRVAENALDDLVKKESARVQRCSTRFFVWAIVTAILIAIGADVFLGPLVCFVLLPILFARRRMNDDVKNAKTAIYGAYDDFQKAKQVADAFESDMRESDESLKAASETLNAS